VPSLSSLSKHKIDSNVVIEMIDKMADHSGDTAAATQLRETSKRLVKTGLPNLAPVLPILLNLKGDPYSLINHFPFEPFFNTFMSRNIVLKCGRQVSKSTSLAAQGVVVSNTIPHFNTLYVTPLYEMIRRFSNNYVRGFIDQSPVKRLWTSTATSSNVLQRGFTNNSNMFFSFAFLDADRTRGLNCDKVGYDEVQDLDSSFIPIIRETMSGSPHGGISQYTGTPKTLDNTLEGLWQRSSQGEWVITCRNCRYENVPAMDYDLDDMIGPWTDDISEENPGTICAKCGHKVFPRDGMWYHAHPERLSEFAGYHVPQCVMPMHYADPDKWAILIGKREGAYNTPINVYYNEVCGESYDTGAKLVTKTDLLEAASLHENKEELAMKTISQYQYRVLGIDWGGGGEKEVSFTTYAVCGIKNDGSIDVIYGFRSLTPYDREREARIALDLAGKFRCQLMAHDYNGAGQDREKYIIDAGYPITRIVPMWYVRAASQGMLRYVEGTPLHPRDHYKLDKARSLVLVCSQIKHRQIKFFAYDHHGEDDPGLLHDFLALVEDKVDSRTGRDIYTIIRQQNQKDDFAHSVNFACCTLWHITQSWPNLAEVDRYRANEDVLKAVEPRADQQDWD